MFITGWKLWMFAYTDGLTETINEKEENSARNVGGLPGGQPQQRQWAMHQDIIVKLDGFKGKNNVIKNDITMLSCRVI